MKRLWIAAALSLCATSVLATTYALIPPEPLAGASVVRLEMRYGRTLSSDDGSEVLFSGDRRHAFTETVRASLGSRLAAAGIELESKSTSWRTDRARYESTGAPHHRLEIVVSGRDVREETGGGIDYGFLVEARLHSEFLTPEYDSVETFSTQRMGFAAGTDLEAEILRVVTGIAGEILDFDSDYDPPEKQTLRLPGGRWSLDLTPPGYGDLLAYYRHQLDDLPGEAALFAEPREASAEPTATFPLIGAYPPSRVLVAGGGRYLVTIHPHWSHRPKPHVVIYRADGSIVRGLALGDLLTRREAGSFLSSSHQHWAWADHAIDDDRGRLIFALPTGHRFGGAPADRVARIEIDLRAGKLVHPTRDYLAHIEPRVALASVPEDAGAPPRATAESFTCREGRAPEASAFAEAGELPLRDLLAGSVTRPMPRYTEIGRKARVTGRVGLELLVAESGEVVCAGFTEKLPLGLAEEARKWVLRWRLAPLASPAQFARGHVAFDFDLEIIQPEPY